MYGNNAYGLHLTLDLYGVKNKAINNCEFIFNFLDQMPALINMKQIMTPQVRPWRPSDVKDGGVSGIVMVATSHLSIHTYPYYNFLSFDCFSCNKFDVNKVEAFLKKVFQPEEVEKNVIIRGSRFRKLGVTPALKMEQSQEV